MIIFIKKKLKRLFFKIKNMNKKVIIKMHSDISSKSEFSGANKIGEYSIFSGKIGYGSYIGKHCSIDASIGKYCCIANNVNVVSGIHPTSKFVTIHPSFYSLSKQSGETYVSTQLFKERKYADKLERFDVVIGNDVWIGSGATIMGGVTIGDGAIIAASATVVHDVEPYTIVGGVPAKLIKKRFTDEQITFLCNFKWWNRDIKWIKENAKFFVDVEEFIKREDK